MEKTVTDVYDFESIIGEGNSSSVVMATHNDTKQQYAIKIIDKSKIVDEVQRERIDREVAILKMCSHPHIIKLKETFESDMEISLVMEYMRGGDLFDRITSKGFFTEEEARVSMFSIMSAVDYLHERSLVHRDLKPENLLYSSQDEDAILKIADFGLSKYSNEADGLVTPCGTLAYTAPEVTNNKMYRKGVDVWSCGCIMYFMLFGRPPFYSENEDEIYDLVSEGIWSFPNKPRVSDPAKELIGFLLEKDPSKRYTVKQALSHPWTTGTAHMSMTLASTPPHHGSRPLSIPSLRASLHSAIDAQRGPLTPPLASPLESPLWKKRAKARAMHATAPSTSSKPPPTPTRALTEIYIEESNKWKSSKNEDDVNMDTDSDMEMDMDMVFLSEGKQGANVNGWTKKSTVSLTP
jgi:calcium/calmodulin-dependent protein kinase I